MSISYDSVLRLPGPGNSEISDILEPALTFLRTSLFYSPWLCCLMRALLGGIFFIAGGAKLVDPRAFARTISAYGLLPEDLLVPTAIGLPAIELLAGLGLLFKVRGSLAAIFRASDMLSFRPGVRNLEKYRCRLRLFFPDGNPCKEQPSCSVSEGPGFNGRIVLSHVVARVQNRLARNMNSKTIKEQ